MKDLDTKQQDIISLAYHALSLFMRNSDWNNNRFETLLDTYNMRLASLPTGYRRKAFILHHIHIFTKDKKLSCYLNYDRTLILLAISFCAEWHQAKTSNVREVTDRVKEIKKAFALLNKINVMEII